MKSVHLGRNETPEMEKQFGLCFGKLPAEELYVVKKDLYQLKKTLPPIRIIPKSIKSFPDA